MKIPNQVKAAVRAAIRTRKQNLRKRLRADVVVQLAERNLTRATAALELANQQYTAMNKQNEEANTAATRAIIDAANASGFNAGDAIQLLYAKSK